MWEFIQLSAETIKWGTSVLKPHIENMPFMIWMSSIIGVVLSFLHKDTKKPDICLASGQLSNCWVGCIKASVLMQRLSYPTETVISNKITRNRIVLSFKVCSIKPLWRPPLWRKKLPVINFSLRCPPAPLRPFPESRPSSVQSDSRHVGREPAIRRCVHSLTTWASTSTVVGPENIPH